MDRGSKEEGQPVKAALKEELKPGLEGEAEEQPRVAVSIGGRVGRHESVVAEVVEGVLVDTRAQGCVLEGEARDGVAGVDLSVIEDVEQLSAEVEHEALREFE